MRINRKHNVQQQEVVMSQYKFFSMLVMVVLIGSSCSASPTQILTVVPPTQTVTLTATLTATATPTPTTTPTPTVTLTPLPTTVAGGNGNLVMSCMNTQGFYQDGISIYNLASSSFTPISENLTRTKELVVSEKAISVSPSGEFILWRRCNYENMINSFAPSKEACNLFISDSAFSTIEELPQEYSYSSSLVSDTTLFGYEMDDPRDVFSPVVMSLYNIPENKNYSLGKYKSAYPISVYPSPTGEFVALRYSTDKAMPLTTWYTGIVDVTSHKLLETRFTPEEFYGWFSEEEILYFDTALNKFLVYNVTTKDIDRSQEEFGLTSPNKAWLAYPKENNGKWELNLRDLQTGANVVIPNTAGGWYLDWSPNGDHILYTLAKGNETQLMSYDIKGNREAPPKI